MEKDLEQLKNEYTQVKQGLINLKESTKSDKSEEATNLKSKATELENNIQNRIDELRETNESKANEAEKFLNKTKKEIDNLYDDIIGTLAEFPSTPPSTTMPPDTTKTRGNIFSKSWGRIKDQWRDIRDKSKRKGETLTNVLRTVGFAATGVGAAALAYKGIKKLFGQGKKGKAKSGEGREE